MNATAPMLRDPRAERFTPKLFLAFRLVESRNGFTKATGWKSYPLPLGDPPETLTEAMTAATAACLLHKDRLAIRETDELTGATVLHLYAVKQKSTPRYVHRDHRTVPVRDLYLEPICSVPGEVFA
jgi:hypothetical protein